MCEPATIIALGVAAVSAVAQHKAQSNQAKLEDAAAQTAYANDQTQLGEQYQQQNDQLNQEQTQRSREAMVERGRLNAAFGEGGLGGNSMNRVADMTEFNLGQDLATMENNRGNLTKQARMQGEGARATAQSRFNSTTRPSFVDTGLKIAGAAAGDAGFQTWANKKFK